MTIFVMHDEDSTDFDWVYDWLEKWKENVVIADYSSGGWEHLWDLEAPQEALDEVPQDYFCASAWATPEFFEKPSILQKIKRLLTQ